MFAASQNNATLVKVLANHPKIWINQADKSGQTALHHACWHSPKTNGLAAYHLLNHPQINVNWANNWGQTPIFKAVHNGNGAALGLLLRHKHINLNYLDHERRTPLIYAIVSAGNQNAAITLINDSRMGGWVCHTSRHGSASCQAPGRGFWGVQRALNQRGVLCCRGHDLFCPLRATRCVNWS